MSEFDALLDTLGRRRRGKLPSLTMRAFTGRYMVHGDISRAQCLIVPAFGYEVDTSGKAAPGASNEYLARMAVNRYAALPKILQFEVDDAYQRLRPEQTYRIEHHRAAGRYLDTREFAAQAKAIMSSNGWENAAVLAQPFHLPRTDSVLRKLGINTIVEDGIEPVWTTDSEQPWTTSPRRWVPHELAAFAVSASRDWLDT